MNESKERKYHSSMSEQLDEERERLPQARVPKKHPRHPITIENTPEETIRIMEGFPERAAKFREFIRGLRKTDSG